MQRRLKHCSRGDIIVDEQGETYIVGGKVKSHPTLCCLIDKDGKEEPRSVEEFVGMLYPVKDALLLALAVVEQNKIAK